MRKRLLAIILGSFIIQISPYILLVMYAIRTTILGELQASIVSVDSKGPRHFLAMKSEKTVFEMILSNLIKNK